MCVVLVHHAVRSYSYVCKINISHIISRRFVSFTTHNIVHIMTHAFDDMPTLDSFLGVDVYIPNEFEFRNT